MSLFDATPVIADSAGTELTIVQGTAISGSQSGIPIIGSDGTSARILLTDSSGRLVTAPQSASSSTSGFASGYVNTAATTITSVRNSTYVEQVTNAQRSLLSASANDTSAGTGARTVRITYYDATYAGPFTDTITLNGVTPVNTNNSNLCYIEKMEVLTVGSGGSNAGSIALRAATAGGGTTIGSIGTSDNQTFWCHHYVPSGKTCSITSVSVCHNGTTVGSGGLFVVKAQTLNVSNSVDSQVTDFIRLYGQSSITPRVYGTAVRVTGPARITMYVTPETGSSTFYRSAFDFYDS